MKIMKEKIKYYLSANSVEKFSEAKLFYSMGLKHKEKKKFSAALHSLIKEGCLKKEKGIYRVKSHSKKVLTAEIDRLIETFAFAKGEDGNEYFIPGSRLGGAVPGDTVELLPIRGEGNRVSAKVVNIKKFSDRLFSGNIVRYGQNTFMSSQELGKDPVLITAEGAESGDKVLAEISSRKNGKIRLRAIRNFGECASAAEAAELYLREKGVPMEFPENVLSEAKVLSSLPVIPDGRRDIRDIPLFTIDSEYSKDLDDAVSAEKTENGYRLFVSIADVSYYVREYSPLDGEAYLRGTSIYYADRVIPMLPKELSNGICSLNPNEDRYSLTCEALLTEDGEILSFEFYKSVMRSRVKGVYKEINALIEGKALPEIKEKYSSLTSQIFVMKELFEKLIKKREQRKVINFETPESIFTIGKDGKAADIGIRTRGISECMIEEFMIVANRCAALFSEKHSLPFIYRIHEKPNPEKAEELKKFLLGIGAEIPPSADLTDGSVLYSIEESLEASPLKFVADKQILRTMAKARYSEINSGHFGLALTHYSHFTSPIRRYPDLAIHRIISDFLASPDKSLTKKYSEFVCNAAIQSSNTERVAATAERDIDDKYRAEYAASHIGEKYEGIISGVASSGFFVMLANTLEGFVSLEDRKNFILTEGVMLRNPVTGICYKIGNSVKIEIKSADIFSGKTDFCLSDD